MRNPNNRFHLGNIVGSTTDDRFIRISLTLDESRQPVDTTVVIGGLTDMDEIYRHVRGELRQRYNNQTINW